MKNAAAGNVLSPRDMAVGTAIALVMTAIFIGLSSVLFFIVYGALGNAISHTSWVVTAGAYRPGFVTALAYWIVGPWLLYKLLGRRSPVVVAVLGFAAVLVPTVTIFAVR